MSEHHIPDVTADVVRFRGQYTLKIVCPYCGRTHSHGGGKIGEPILDGHRVAHCHGRDDNGAGYNIVVRE